jgi:hypothetical protein
MRLLPQQTQLGKLELIEVYEYYDTPCLFSCRNSLGQLFIAILFEQEKKVEKWLYASISQRRFENIRAGLIDIRNAFLNSEDGFVYQVIINSDDSPDKVEMIWCENLIDDWLPMPNEFIEFANEPFPLLEVKDY